MVYFIWVSCGSFYFLSDWFVSHLIMKFTCVELFMYCFVFLTSSESVLTLPLLLLILLI